MAYPLSDDGVGFDSSPADPFSLPIASGFGLISLQERARLAGGSIELRSAPGMGTQIDASIPYQPGPEADSLQQETVVAATTTQPAAAGDIRVLIVDDHEVMRSGIRKLLEESTDVTVAGEASDGEDAIQQIQALAPDVVLLDIQMPKLDGVETLRRLRELGVEAPVILLSTYARDDYIFDGLRAGARGYLLKDVGKDDLVHAIRTVHGGASLLQPVIAKRLIERLDTQISFRITNRERQVIQLLASGARNKEIAAELYISDYTVKFHVQNLYKKLGVRTRAEAVRVATEHDLLSP